MEVKDKIITLVAIIFMIVIASSFFIGGGPDIVEAVDDKYSLKSVDGRIRTYYSNDDVNATIYNIDYIKEPYDQKIKSGEKGILLYDEAVIVVEDKDGRTEIELVRDHKTAYHRHHNTMFLFWGNNLYRDGRIRTPRSMRNGSIGSSPSRGGGFGFGK